MRVVSTRINRVKSDMEICRNDFGVNIVLVFSGPPIYEAVALREWVLNNNQDVGNILYIKYPLNKSLFSSLNLLCKNYLIKIFWSLVLCKISISC